MPSVSVPLKDERGWTMLMRHRREWWAQKDRNKLTDNFKAVEFYCHDSSPCPTVSRNAMLRLAEDYLEPMRARFGQCLILSGYRHEAYNQRIGGARWSQHVYEHTFECVAADLRFQKGTPAQWGAMAKTLRTKHGGKGGVGIYPRSNFVHVDNRGWKADWAG